MSDFELTVTRDALRDVLAGAVKIASKKSPLAILKCVLLDASGETLRVLATDTFIGIEESMAATVKTPGRTAVDASKLFDLVKELPAGSVSLRIVKAHLELRAGKAKLKVPAIPADDFPVLPAAADARVVAKLDANELARAAKQGSYAMVVSDTRPALAGTLIETDGQAIVYLVSADGLRLAVARASASGECTPASLLVPLKGVAELRWLAESRKGSTIEIREHAGSAFFLAEGITINVKLLDHPFVPWAKFLANTAPTQQVTFSRGALAGVVRRIAKVSETADGGVVTLAFSEGLLRVSGAASGEGEGEDELECNAIVEQTVHVNPGLFVQAVEAVSDDEVLVLPQGTKAIEVRGAVSTDVRGLVMLRSAAAK